MELSAIHCLQNLRNTIRNHCIPKGATVLTDGGPENQGGISEFLAQPEVKIIPQIGVEGHAVFQ